MPTSFTDKVAVVTGAASGLGQSTAILLSQAGARLVLFDRDATGLSQTAAQCSGAVTVTGDVTSADDLARLASTAQSIGPVTLLATAAGLLGPAVSLTEVTEAEWDRLFDVNVKGTWLTMRAFLPAMRAAGGGSIVAFSSAAGLTGSETMPAYSASKGAVVMLTRSAARTEAPHGIRVNCVCPGSIETPMLEATFASAGSPEERAQREAVFKARHPLGRFGKAHEVASTVLFLLSDAASFVTGAAVPVDGGRLA